MIRPAGEGDVDVLARLAGELGYPSTAEEMRARMARLSEDDAVLVAEDDGIVVGWLHVAAVFALQSGAYALIHGLVVSEAKRGGGIGAALVRAAEAWARGRGLGRMRVRTNVSRTRTHSFYERCGFEHTKTSRLYEKRL